jgi:hypothetical protein
MMENQYKPKCSQGFLCVAQAEKTEGETPNRENNACTVRVSFATEIQNADVFPSIMKRLTASFRTAAKPQDGGFAHLR